MKIEISRTNPRQPKAARLEVRIDPTTWSTIREIAQRDHGGNVSAATRTLLARAAVQETTAKVRSEHAVRMG
jgi:hypothetical protein